ncbi:MAG: winged helix-turn-helix transcriptional regulator [Paracoccaceae bacterium]
MAERRYHDACAAAHALDLLGERWALLVVRELMTGPKRFTDLRAGLPGISANVLTQRLAGLEAHGIVARRQLPPPAAVQVYELTPWGYEAEPIFRALGRWAARSPHHDPTAPFSAASFMLSLRTMADPGRAGGRRLSVGFVIGHERLRATLSTEGFTCAPDALESADVVATGPAEALAALIYAGVAPERLEAEGAIAVTGERGVLDAFARCFPLPDKAPVAT